ncbi:alpha/beta fold hydrolase [Streptomyces microflavus]|uniref:alpha/beta fold hydrolase n=1 Tax=Streptomyces microflavus TaxID=1919 RepID=UPI003B21227E
MTNFVLVAGAWLGSWAWNDVLPDLRADGHAVHPLTLSGLADKQGVAAGQQTHVDDIVDYVERLDLHDVVLVGHSYSGIPAGQAAERIGDRLARAVFVDSNVPADGESFVSGWAEGRAADRGGDRRERQLLAPADGGRLRRSGTRRRGDRPDRGGGDPAPGRHAHRAGRPARTARFAARDVHQVPARRSRAGR